jgi:hypothetical protein
MAYIQKNNPIKVTGCGRRRSRISGNGMAMKDKQGIVEVDAGPLTSKKLLKKVSGQLKDASKKHAGQAAKIDKTISAMPMKTPMKKISGPCKAAAKRKFKVWPSAYASGWGVRCTKAGGPSKFGG